MAKRVVITGRNGFIGTNLWFALAGNAKYKVDIVGLPMSDVCFIDSLAAKIHDPDTVVHLAAIPGVPNCKENPIEAFDTNVSGTVSVLDKLSANGKIIFASSGAAEESRSVYGATKRASEEMIRGYAYDFGPKCFILRFSNVYGPHSAHKTSFITKMMQAAISGKPLVIHGNGEQRRDFIFVQDVCNVIQDAIDVNPIHLRPIGIASGTMTSINELIEIFTDTCGAACHVEYDDQPPGVIWPPRPIRAAKAIDGIEVKTTSLQDGLRLTWDWFLSQESESCS